MISTLPVNLETEIPGASRDLVAKDSTAFLPVDIEIVPGLALCCRSEDWLWQLRSELQSRWQFLATNTLRFLIFLPTRTSEIAPYHTFHRQWFCFTHNHRATRELIAKQL
jgi:hypothetical protein